MPALIFTIIVSIFYCEVIWWILKTEKRSPRHLQNLVKFMMILNFIMGILLSSVGNLVFAGIISFYYFLLIPHRLLKQ